MSNKKIKRLYLSDRSFFAKITKTLPGAKKIPRLNMAGDDIRLKNPINVRADRVVPVYAPGFVRDWIWIVFSG